MPLLITLTVEAKSASLSYYSLEKPKEFINLAQRESMLNLKLEEF